MLNTKIILSENLTKLLETRNDISRLDLSKRMGVADGTLGRIKYGTGNPNVETIEQIARFFRIEPWHLLVKGLDPKDPPKPLRADSEMDQNAPVVHQAHMKDTSEKELIHLFQQLDEQGKSYLLQHARLFADLKKHESNH